MKPRRRLASIWAKVALRGCDSVGSDVRLIGRPSVDNRGHLKIGRGAVICSRPVVAQLATGEDGALLIGAGVMIGYGCSLFADALVSIGDATHIGPFGIVCDIDTDAVSGWQHTSRPIVIGSNVRIGSKVTILSGTYVGDGAEIAAGSVVSGVVPPLCSVAGAPARASGPPAARPTSDPSTRIAQIVAEVFGRKDPPALSLQPEQLSGWGAEGALRLLLALEGEFQTRIPDEEWLGIRSLADVARIIQRRTGAAAAQDSSSTELATQVH